MFVGYLTNTDRLQIITVERDEVQASAEVQRFVWTVYGRTDGAFERTCCAKPARHLQINKHQKLLVSGTSARTS